MKNTINVFCFICLITLLLAACKPSSENQSVPPQPIGLSGSVKGNSDTVPPVTDTKQDEDNKIHISVPIDWEHIDLTDEQVVNFIAEHLCQANGYNPLEQIPGEPYRPDPCALSHSCERKFHELPAKAEAGDPVAQNELGHAILECGGWLMSDKYEDYFKSSKEFDLFLASAKQGNMDSMLRVGGMYLRGYDIDPLPKQNTKEAEKWLTKAAEMGNSVAALWIARIYTEGLLGTDKDSQKARKWANVSLEADPKNTSANYYLGLLALDEKEYAKAAKLFAACQYDEWWLTNECRHAKYQLSKLYQKGLGVPLDLYKAKELYAESRNDEEFAPLLPNEDLKSVSQNRLWQNATYDNDPLSQYELGRRYENGEGVEKDVFHAAEWYYRAAQQNNPDALYALAMLDLPYPEGLKDWGCSVDYIPQRYMWLKKAADQGHTRAAYELGKMYQKGVFYGAGGVSNRCVGGGLGSDVIIGRNEEKAKYYFKKSGMKPPTEK